MVMNKNKIFRTVLILLAVIGVIALMGVQNVRAKIARQRIWAARQAAAYRLQWSGRRSEYRG